MGREAIGGRVLVRLGDGVPERIDAVVGRGGRSEFVRRAVLVALGDAVVDVVAPDPVPASKPALTGDDAELLAAVGAGRWTTREVCRALGWTELRLDRAVKRLGDRIVFHGGGVMSVAEDGSDG